MSPGAYARGGSGLTIRWGWFDSPFGAALVMATERGICGLGLAEETGAEATMADLRSRWPEAAFVEDPDTLRPMVDAAFGQDERTPVRLALIGAPFQLKVWEALLAIPSGHVTTYSRDRTGHRPPGRRPRRGHGRGPQPRSRGSFPAIGRCAKSGGLGGYHWGLPVKRAILAREAAALDATG